jgi:pimeloyl-ACP methyl ester carboxylesterase
MSNRADDFEYDEAGSGPAVLLLPGSFGTGAGWKSVRERLGDGYRVVTTSLLGYGRTPETRPIGNATMDQQVEVLDRILDRIGTAPHVVAHSFGGLAAIVHALRGRRRAASLLLVEANPLGVLRSVGDEEHYEMFSRMTARYFAAFAAQDPESARHVIDFYGGAGAFDAMPEKVRSYIVATTPANVRDWSSGTPFEPHAAALGSIGIPTIVMRGGSGHPAMLRIAEVLFRSIPGARLVTIEGGSHFLPSTHPDAIAALIAQQVDGTLGEHRQR